MLSAIRRRHAEAIDPSVCEDCGLPFASDHDNATTGPGDRPDLCWSAWRNCGVQWGVFVDWRERYARDVGALLTVLDGQ